MDGHHEDSTSRRDNLLDVDLVLDFAPGQDEVVEVVRLVNPVNYGDGWDTIGRFELSLVGVRRAFEMVGRTDKFWNVVMLPLCQPFGFDVGAGKAWRRYLDRRNQT